jgi:hypothetical protein
MPDKEFTDGMSEFFTIVNSEPNLRSQNCCGLVYQRSVFGIKCPMTAAAAVDERCIGALSQRYQTSMPQWMEIVHHKPALEYHKVTR